jgi:hypothetical protein
MQMLVGFVVNTASLPGRLGYGRLDREKGK